MRIETFIRKQLGMKAHWVTKVEATAEPGPVGVHARNFSKVHIKSLGWEAKYSLKEGIARTYPWVEKQVRAAQVTR